ARTRTADLNLQRAHTVLLRLLRAIFSSNLGSKRSRLTRTLEALRTRGGPGNRIALRIRDGDHGVVEGRVHMRDTRRNILTFPTTNAGGFLSHISPFTDLYAAVIPAATPCGEW